MTLELYVLARWLHLLGLLVWIGHNYANVVQRPRYRPVDPVDTAAADQLFMQAAQREHGTFRYASLVVLASGLYMLWFRGILTEALTLQGQFAVLGLGVWIGLLMTANLWFVLWPHQKKVLGFVPAAHAERVRCSRITFLSSRTNTILSFPAVFLMTAGAHAPTLF
ncbi:MAG: urate hydroxylase PuuD [Gammaproteobacteria bacterium]